MTPDARSLPVYWGRWFEPLQDGTMKRTNLNVFYRLGAELSSALERLHVGMNATDFILAFIFSEKWLQSFIDETNDVRLVDTRASARYMLDVVRSIIRIEPMDFNRALTEKEVQLLIGLKDSFERDFERELRNIAVFTVSTKGIYDTNALLERPEEKFPESIRRLFPEQMLYDIRQAAKCFAFEVPTACAFHICRATETFILKYYEALTKHEWSLNQRDWGRYIQELRNEKAPETITTRLDEIRKMDRNVYIHPNTNVTLDDAPIIFDLCTGVIFQIGQELEKLLKKS